MPSTVGALLSAGTNVFAAVASDDGRVPSILAVFVERKDAAVCLTERVRIKAPAVPPG